MYVFRAYLLSLGVGLAIFLATSVCAHGAESPEVLDLRPRFEEGRSTRYQVWTRREQTHAVEFQGNSRSFETVIELDGEATWVVRSVSSDGSAECQMTMEWMTATVTGHDGTVQRNDSRKGSGQTPPIHAMLRAICKVPIRVDVGPDGSVHSVKGTQAVRRQMPDGVEAPADLDFIEAANDLALLAGVPGEAWIDKSWKVDAQRGHSFGHLEESASYTPTGVEWLEGVPVATIVGNAQLDLVPDLSRMSEVDADVDIQFTKGRVDSQVMFDLSRHEVVGRNAIQEQRAELVVSMGDQRLTRILDEVIQSQALRIEEK